MCRSHDYDHARETTTAAYEEEHDTRLAVKGGRARSRTRHHVAREAAFGYRITWASHTWSGTATNQGSA